MAKIHTVILAAGRSTRMHSTHSKVLHTLAGKPLLEHILDSINPLSQRIYIVCGYDQKNLQKTFNDRSINWVEQTQQLGTAHAVNCTLPFIDNNDDIVLIIYGDVPLIQAQTLTNLIHQAQSTGICLLTAQLNNPTNYGRIIRQNNNVVQIIEQKDADKKTLSIKEINTGMMAIRANLLHQFLPQIKNNNAQQEYYLTDLIALLNQNNTIVSALVCDNHLEITGVNNKTQLAQLERDYQAQLARKFTQEGLQLLDPSRFDCRGSLTFGQDCQIDVNVIIKGKVKIGQRVMIEANCILTNCIIGDDCHIHSHSVLEDCQLESQVQVGPFARIRPQTHLKEKSKIGNFVEIKKSTIGNHSKVNHLSYIGDTTIGKNVNVGAGVITCNYDGANKHQTTIQDNAFIGSITALVAPIDVGKNATIGAGSTITKNTPDNDLTLSRAKQLSLKNWQRPNKIKFKGVD